MLHSSDLVAFLFRILFDLDVAGHSLGDSIVSENHQEDI